MNFQFGRSYNRVHIRSAIGGELRSYMPREAGRIVAICVSPNLNSNPPEVILVGKSPDVEERAEQFIQQAEALPAFVEIAPSQWMYVGVWALETATTDPAVIACEAAHVSRTDVVRVLYLKQVSR